MDKRNDNYDLDEILSGNYESDENFTLENILSEYKGDAFIAGERKTPSSELDDKVNEILRSVGVGPLDKKKDEKPEDEVEEDISIFSSSKNDAKTDSDVVDEPTRIINLDDYRKEASIDTDNYSNDDRSDEEKFFGDEEAEDVELDIPDWDNSKDETVSEKFSKKDEKEDFSDFDYYEDYDPDPEEEIKRIGKPIRLYKLRSYGALFLTAVIAIFTFMYESNASLPFGIGYSASVSTGVLMILGFLVMMLGIDVLIRGTEDLIRGEAGIETIVLFSCIFTAADGFVMLASHSYDKGLPFMLISSASLFFTMRGKLAYDQAMIDSLKAFKTTNNPFGVIIDNETDPERYIIKKVRGRSDGFYSKLTSKDTGELIYTYLTPLLIVLAFVFALIASVGRGKAENFSHSFAIFISVSAAFPAAMMFALPFKYVASILKNTGSALAGWGGASDIADADGTVITDEDVFPAGSVSLSGVKFFEGVNSHNALVESSSLIIASACGISRIFSELLKSQGLEAKSVDKFTFYEGGGIGGDVDGDHILCGTGAFMNLMGIRVPEKVNLANTVFASVNGELAAVYTVNYVPVNSVHGALRSLLSTKINVLLAVKDFNVTPNVISQKFKVNMDGVEYLPADKIYKVAENDNKTLSGVSATLAREGLSSLAEVISKGKQLKVISELNTLLTIGGTIIGILVMFFLCASGAFANATCGMTFIFMMIIEICVLLLSQYVRNKS